MSTGTQSLTSLASSGLPAGAAAQLQASVNSLSSSSPFPIKMPTVASNTIDRGEVTSLISKNLNDNKIPPPNFAGLISDASDAYVLKQRAARKPYSDALKKREALKESLLAEEAAQKKVVDASIGKFKEVKNTLPQGDPELESLRAAGNVEINKYNKLIEDNKQKNLDSLYELAEAARISNAAEAAG
jgi:hypothetical protein